MKLGEILEGSVEEKYFSSLFKVWIDRDPTACRDPDVVQSEGHAPLCEQCQCCV